MDAYKGGKLPSTGTATRGTARQSCFKNSVKIKFMLQYDVEYTVNGGKGGDQVKHARAPACIKECNRSDVHI